jgi:ethanolaminephosphotransferase
MSAIFRRIKATQDTLTDEILMPLKSYKYQSVDKSYISNYILKHYVLRPLLLPIYRTLSL